MTGLKYDENKPPMALLDPEYLLGVSNVLAFGAAKYSANNWRGGIQYTRLISAALRHISAINSGEDFDPETGLSHAYHLGCCSMFLASMMNHRPDMDDRYKGNTNAIKPNVDNSGALAVRNIWQDHVWMAERAAGQVQGYKNKAFPEPGVAGLYVNGYVEPKCNAGSDGCNVGGAGAMLGGNCTNNDPTSGVKSFPSILCRTHLSWMMLQEAMEQFNAKTRMDNALYQE